MKQLLRQSRLLLAPAALLGVVGLITAMHSTPTALEKVQARGELVVATRPSLTTVYNGPNGPSGMEYELAKGFAKSLGVKLRILRLDNIAQVKDAVRHGRADMAAAGLMVTAEHQDSLRFTTPYQKVDTLVMYRIGEPRPDKIQDLIGKKVVVRAGGSHAEMLVKAERKYPKLTFTEVEHADTEQLLNMVDQGKADYALINSNAYAIHRGLFPDLAAGFTLSKNRGLAWGFNPHSDRSLYLAAQRYLLQAKDSGETARLANRFYGHMKNFNRYAARSFVQHMDDRLPQYANDFREAAANSGFNWRLLAAVSYQESLWDAHAVSPTGVEGLMMLTMKTAHEMGVKNRTNPAKSIEAGAAYLKRIYEQVPAHIPEPDRTWMALAAYNVGLGHLEDARVLTQSQGGNPDSWTAVRKRLPLLGDPAYSKYLRHGPAPGGQAAIYVRHIRHYYDLLVWASNTQRHDQTLLASAD